jgi:hypothetical protein
MAIGSLFKNSFGLDMPYSFPKSAALSTATVEG